MNTVRIELQAIDFYRRIYQIHTRPTPAADNLRDKYIHLRDLLEQVCHEMTLQSEISFANLFARLDFVCRQRGLSPSDTYSVQTLRRNANNILSHTTEPVLTEYLFDLRALLRFVAGCYDQPIPQQLIDEIPSHNRPFREPTRHSIAYLRVSVTGWTDSLIYANTDLDDTHSIVIDYAKGGYNGDLSYLKDLLTPNVQLNLLHVTVDEHLHYIPRLIVLNPDYLIDISALAACFTEYGHHPYAYFLNRLKPRANTHHILMGNLAGRFLDAYINEEPTRPVDYRQTLRDFFTASALEFCTCSIPTDFHAAAQSQMLNIRSFIHDKMPHDIPSFNRHQTLLEASFICEALGLQGRVDMLQRDYRVLVEQKAGKKDEYHNTSRESHFIQMMLYQQVLMYNFQLKETDIQAFLLYSRYADGLLLEHSNTTQFRETIRLRNAIVALEMSTSHGYVSEILRTISPEMLNVKGLANNLWLRYQEPQLAQQINVFHTCSPQERAYFTRFYTFVMREMQLAKTGGGSESARGFASTWHTPTLEKVQSGNLLLELHITEKAMSNPHCGYDLITLAIPHQDTAVIPNFRKGDMIILYAYTTCPDVRHHLLMKGSIVSIQSDQLVIRLRNAQQNPDLIGTATDLFAVEHDASDLTASGGIKALYAFLQAPVHRRQLLLGQRQPRHDETRHLHAQYDRFTPVILKATQALDYFLLVGPPGTGKTSCALRYMVQEALATPGTSLLLMSYTNRAVDEICDMLVSSGIAEQTPFIRIGSELSCHPRFVPYLLERTVAAHARMDQLRQHLIDTRIIVGTTTSLNSRSYLFQLKHFHLAIIDEASQILEPDLVGLLAARYESGSAIDKFILIGDYKQLPAISLQSQQEASITDPLLASLGFTDCRSSLFERLYRHTPEACRHILNRQGRMHPDIAEFANHTFYQREQLECVPLPHQQEDLPYSQPAPDNTDDIYRLLLSRRMIFIPAVTSPDASTSSKCNEAEARIVAQLVSHIYSITSPHFEPTRTIGIIVPYRNQIALIRAHLQALHIDALMHISVDTVERYQGSQRDVIIYSFTVSQYSQLNFLTSNTFTEGDAVIDRKLNVAITRARKQLILIGNPHILGANLTFFKLIEHIRLHNGYINTDTDTFCQGHFALPGEDTDTSSLSAATFTSAAFQRVVSHVEQNFSTLPPTTAAHQLELIDYGRWDGSKCGTPQQAQELALYYHHHVLQRHYCAASTLFTHQSRWFRQSLGGASGRLLLCDFSYEGGATAMALIDTLGQHLHTNLTYIGINASPAIRQMTHDTLTCFSSAQITAGYVNQFDQLTSTFWNAHSVVPEFVLFNVSNCFDRIESTAAIHLAQQLREVMHNYRLHHYAILFRDDSGTGSCLHSYQAFAHELSAQLHPLTPYMPEEKSYSIHNGLEENFIYEIRTNMDEK